MSEKSNDRILKWLHEQIDVWINDTLVSAEQGKTLKDRYPLPVTATSLGTLIFFSIGAILVGLSAILMFAYNWDEFHKLGKLSIIFGSLVLSHISAVFLYRAHHKYLGETLHVLGTMLFGSGIFLIAQIYHIDKHYPNAFLIWAAAAGLFAWILPSKVHGIIASILALIWHASEIIEFSNINYWGPVFQFVVILVLSWRLRSKVLLAIGLIALYITSFMSLWRVEDDAIILPMLFCVSTAFIAIALLIHHTKYFPESSPVISWISHIPYLFILYLLTFPRSVKDIFNSNGLESKFLFFIGAMIALLLWAFALLVRIRKHILSSRIDYMGIPLAVIIISLHTGGIIQLDGWPGAAFFNVLFLFHALMFISWGCRQLSVWHTVIGCFLIVLLGATRFTDLFESLLMRGAVFLVIGIGIFLTGFLYARTKKSKGMVPA
ncbi:DUF2157 domain-containing protein [bacterium]|nr:DUF2157 domain-containing protein [candidate division CSSED10-310 bacterium]